MLEACIVRGLTCIPSLLQIQKPQPNGRALGETQEEIKVTEDVPHHAQTDVKPEKVSEV